MDSKLLGEALMETCRTVHDLRTDGCVDGTVLNANSAQDAVAAFLRDFKRNVPKDYVGHALTKLADTLLSRNITIREMEDTAAGLLEELHAANVRGQAQMEEHARVLAEVRGEAAEVRAKLAGAYGKLSDTCEDLKDAEASVRALRKQIEYETEPDAQG